MRTVDLYKFYEDSNGVSIDSRSINNGEIFFALTGPNFDGHKYLKAAFEKGAKYAVIDNEAYIDNENVLLVRNVEEALQNLARYHRGMITIPVIGITGSNGKTTTKELIASVLRTKYTVYATKGNLNNHLGVPLSILSINETHEIAIIEMGANHLQEIKFLSELSMPDFGLITNIGKAHLEGFGDLEGVRKGKTELYKYVQSIKGTIFYNELDNMLLKSIPSQTKNVKYSINDVIVKANYPSILFEFNNMLVRSNLSGTYNLVNMIAALTIGNYFQLTTKELKNGIENYVPSNNRSQLKETENNVLILDAYNANPSSMTESIHNFSLYPSKEKTLILGHMLELGESTQEEHMNLIKFIQNYNWNKVFLVGDEFFELEVPHTFTKFKDTKALSEMLQYEKVQNQTILLKGSRGIALEKCITFL